MKKAGLIFAAVFFLAPAGLFAQGLSAGAGADFPRYKDAFLDVRAQYIGHIKPDVDLFLGGSFAITTHSSENDDGEKDADFFIPLDIGFNFVFPVNDKFAYYFGLGLTGQALILKNETDRFFMGPFVNLGIRVGVHPYMEWYVEARQDLIFGKPDWINTGTRLSTGVIFPL